MLFIVLLCLICPFFGSNWWKPNDESNIKRGDWKSNTELNIINMVYPSRQMIAAYNESADQILLIGGNQTRYSLMIYDMSSKSFTNSSSLSMEIWSDDGQNYVQTDGNTLYFLDPSYAGTRVMIWNLTTNSLQTLGEKSLLSQYSARKGECIAYFSNDYGEFIVISGGAVQSSKGDGWVTTNDFYIYDIANGSFDDSKIQ